MARAVIQGEDGSNSAVAAQQVLGADDKGLGLIGMRERAALVGGLIEIESQPDAGTTVVVRIAAPRDGSRKDK